MRDKTTNNDDNFVSFKRSVSFKMPSSFIIRFSEAVEITPRTYWILTTIPSAVERIEETDFVPKPAGNDIMISCEWLSEDSFAAVLARLSSGAGVRLPK